MTEQTQRIVAVTSGVVIAVATFVLILALAAWFMPKFLRFTSSPAARLLPLLALVSIFFAVAVMYRSKRRV